MEHSQKNTDCYFFYYSTCLKGDACAFRHEPSALGCETMCQYWQQGNCLNEHCNFRHMELKKNRKSIPCYWEAQPGGCRKPHCCFMHKNARGPAPAEANNPVRNNEHAPKPVNQEWSNRQDDGKYDSDLRTTLDGSSTESDQGRGGSEAGSFIGSPAGVDPLVVNFEEESDNESVPSPTKPQLRLLHVKTLEEIKLERIQAESAAYYNYATEDIADLPQHQKSDRSIVGDLGAATLERNLRARLANRLYTHGSQGSQRSQGNEASQGGNARSAADIRTNLDFQVLSLDEIRKRRRRQPTPSDTESSSKVARMTENFPPNSQDSIIRSPRAAVTASAPPPVRLRRSNRTPAEPSPRNELLRYSGGVQEPPEMTSSDSSQEAAAVPDRLTLVATRPSLSARDERSGIQKREDMDEGIEARLQDQNRTSVVEDGVASPAAGIRASRSISVPSVSEYDDLMMDTGSVDHSAIGDDILQDIDELLND